ncbi:MAG: hypothetical protein COB46_04410 [Rhodospirillaceae bacterium]|nr:MAG: hypothetical protein COB46_04410 [Rhodospirillaceae bacterium]
MMMSLSVVVPVHAKPNRTRITLCSLAAQDLSFPVEIIIVADNPTQDVLDLVNSHEGHAKIVVTKGLGRAGARNKGAQEATGNILVFLDDDILTDPNFLSWHYKSQQAQRGLIHGSLRELIGLSKVDDPRDGGPGCPKICLEDLQLGKWEGYLKARTVANALERAVEKYWDNSLDVDAPWLSGAGANISVPKDIWHAVAGFDQAYGLRWGMEDLDFAYRLHTAGYQIMFCPQARGYHMSHYSPSRWEDHDANLEMFQQRAKSPEAAALSHLLAADGSPEKYEDAVRQIRNAAENSL